MAGPTEVLQVKVFAENGTLLFEGSVSQQGDFLHMESYPTGRVVTCRVHDKMPTLKENT